MVSFTRVGVLAYIPTPLPSITPCTLLTQSRHSHSISHSPHSVPPYSCSSPSAFLSQFSHPAHSGHTIIVDAMDELEVVVNDPRYGKVDGNHIFINVAPVLTISPTQYAQDLLVRVRVGCLRTWKQS